MTSHGLLPFVPPAVEKPACASCKTFAPDCVVPVGEGSRNMCWLCAHQVVDHDVCVEHAYAAECGCCAAEIYPEHVVTARKMTTKEQLEKCLTPRQVAIVNAPAARPRASIRRT